jgi:hypothetical protein
VRFTIIVTRSYLSAVLKLWPLWVTSQLDPAHFDKCDSRDFGGELTLGLSPDRCKSNDTNVEWTPVEKRCSRIISQPVICGVPCVQDVGQRPADKWYIMTCSALHSLCWSAAAVTRHHHPLYRRVFVSTSPKENSLPNGNVHFLIQLDNTKYFPKSI